MNSALPGEDLIEAGVSDLREQRETVAALLVAIGAPRLRRLQVDLPDVLPDDPERRLYELLAKDEPDSAHSRYNALIRRLVSYERAAECEKGITLRTKLEEFLTTIPKESGFVH
jgi:broad specificity phosphatase PhoE